MVDFSLLRQPNFLATATGAFEAGQQQRQQRDRRNALAGYATNPEATRNALLGMGDIETAGQLQGYEANQARQAYQGQVQERQAKQWSQEDADLARQSVLREAYSLRTLPAEQRGQAYQARAVPLLQEIGVPQADIDRVLADGMLSDEEIDSFIVQMGGDLAPLQSVNLGQGGVGTFNPNRYDPQSAFSVVREPSERPAPKGYAWTPDGGMVAIPGGPADPRTIEQQATVRRQATVRNPMPSRARSGGGSSSVPSGFVLD